MMTCIYYIATPSNREGNYRFSTVSYDNQMFRDYVIDQTIHNRNEIDTVSKERIANAFDFFCNELADKTEEELLQLLEAMTKASCTTHVVKDESEAVQMFIFQNKSWQEAYKFGDYQSPVYVRHTSVCARRR